MQDLLIDCTVRCPTCWEQHTVTIDVTAPDRSIIEDCHVCCNPMQLSFQLDGENALYDVAVDSA
ncbi:MAG: CPXCG motif-containing cysteine-rich protein [Gammaproteobacteria bacterium]|nr:CPXCG motif-containing cysteine-rich protein [Gammaproteobacteria bacterium]NNF61045.1 CPXCG motif-containing cysteine-rich protein [Gammaproteobacteria bacterium]NNM21442.1 CPXCG motif-containing cysteine-rich protein [Gammaproteobacteria bacterium]